ncbi:MAG: hypothetical protein AB7F59_09790 [Bdellovibrionales bacterium]
MKTLFTLILLSMAFNDVQANDYAIKAKNKTDQIFADKARGGECEGISCPRTIGYMQNGAVQTAYLKSLACTGSRYDSNTGLQSVVSIAPQSTSAFAGNLQYTKSKRNHSSGYGDFGVYQKNVYYQAIVEDLHYVITLGSKPTFGNSYQLSIIKVAKTPSTETPSFFIYQRIKDGQTVAIDQVPLHCVALSI